LASLFSSHSYAVEKQQIVADEADQIQQIIREWVDSPRIQQGLDLVVTTGGTGFGVRDVTPEVVY
jgi:gephyrin